MTQPLRSAMHQMTPLQVFQPAADQRLSSRKITCKAFPFVVEEQRVTSYLLLVKKNDVPSETLWICTSIFLLPMSGRRDLGRAPSGLFTGFPNSLFVEDR